MTDQPSELPCDTCRGTGIVDDSLGGIGTSGTHPCPDCDRGWPIMSDAERGRRVLYRLRAEMPDVQRRALS